MATRDFSIILPVAQLALSWGGERRALGDSARVVESSPGSARPRTRESCAPPRHNREWRFCIPPVAQPGVAGGPLSAARLEPPSRHRAGQLDRGPTGRRARGHPRGNGVSESYRSPSRGDGRPALGGSTRAAESLPRSARPRTQAGRAQPRCNGDSASHRSTRPAGVAGELSGCSRRLCSSRQDHSAVSSTADSDFKFGLASPWRDGDSAARRFRVGYVASPHDDPAPNVRRPRVNSHKLVTVREALSRDRAHPWPYLILSTLLRFDSNFFFCLLFILF
jgi:hypothetical protein